MKRRVQLVAAVLGIAGLFAGAAAAASSPAVRTGSPTAIKQFSAVLQGAVNPDGASTAYFFQYGLTNGYGANTPAHGVGSGTKSVAVKAAARNLIPGTTYHYRLAATNRFGITYGGDRTFTTAGPPPPTVATGQATAVKTNGATLTGVVNPNGAVTGYRFNYGTTTGYGSQTNAVTVPAGKTPQIVAYAISGLAKQTVFHYQLIAFHGSKVVSTGADQVFMTLPSPRPRPTLFTHTTPHHAAHAPYVFTTRGRVLGPPWIPGQFDCSGFVSVRYFLGHRNVSYILAPVQPDCTFVAQATFTHRPGRGSRHRLVTLTQQTRFRGNGYLTPRRGHNGHVTLGG